MIRQLTLFLFAIYLYIHTLEKKKKKNEKRKKENDQVWEVHTNQTGEGIDARQIDLEDLPHPHFTLSMCLNGQP